MSDYAPTTSHRPHLPLRLFGVGLRRCHDNLGVVSREEMFQSEAEDGREGRGGEEEEGVSE